MKHVTRALGLLTGLGLLATGCVNLAGANLSNIGNGNSVKTGDIASGNTIKDNGNNNGNNNGNPNGNPDGNHNSGPRFTGISLNHGSFTLYRLQPGVDMGMLFNDNAFNNQPHNPGGYTSYPISSPSFENYPGDLANLMVEATAHDMGGGSFRINKEDGQFAWELPAGVQLARVDRPSTNGMPAVVATSDAATGSFELKVRWNADPSIFATASVEILDQGAAKVVID